MESFAEPLVVRVQYAGKAGPPRRDLPLQGVQLMGEQRRADLRRRLKRDERLALRYVVGRPVFLDEVFLNVDNDLPGRALFSSYGFTRVVVVIIVGSFDSDCVRQLLTHFGRCGDTLTLVLYMRLPLFDRLIDFYPQDIHGVLIEMDPDTPEFQRKGLRQPDVRHMRQEIERRLLPYTDPDRSVCILRRLDEHGRRTGFGVFLASASLLLARLVPARPHYLRQTLGDGCARVGGEGSTLLRPCPLLLTHHPKGGFEIVVDDEIGVPAK